ncbi:protein SPT2 homolog [Solenopsis invicta]|uniref:protein SPT2 homolog n=1 Tax=Solenopsis invicta TaxID=13686 RepID=UPI000595BF68|nr:protein SPT2 homolog [Solenopsis invicta]XP_011166675.1 protein SPT2 homolog [Solenopsis invicta]
MDFGTVISVAQKNETKKQTVPDRCYQTKFTPPKKQSKQSKSLSDNIKKFLARKEEEERQKALQEKRKKENLLSLRDQKTQNRINKHLKVCKAANKSVIEDAIDSENTAITIAGPSQPDEDDYGYESQTASALYNQFMSKYNSLPQEKPIFNNETRTVKDIASTKDRVKQALKQELEESSGHRKRRKSSNAKEIDVDEKIEKTTKSKENSKEINNKINENKDEKPKIKKKSLPPPMGFADLLKLAEIKQREPVVIEIKPKVEKERPMTKRQKLEYVQEKERKEQRERKDLEVSKKTSLMNSSSKLDKTQSNKIPKSNEKSVISNLTLNKNASKCSTTISKQITDKSDKYNIQKSNSNKSSSKNEILEERKKLETERRQLEEMRRAIEEEKRKLAQSKNKLEDLKSQPKLNAAKSKSINKQISSKNIKQQFSSSDLKLQSSLTNTKPRQFPPSDVRPVKSKTVVKKAFNKRRIYDNEKEDSDLSDFIDDGPGNDEEDYSKHISEIFGYDKSKYKNIDDEDDIAMESNFAQQLKEEYISSKIGYMEDLEDMRIEAIEKKRKAILKKRSQK